MDDVSLRKVYDLATAAEQSTELEDCLQHAGVDTADLQDSLRRAITIMRDPVIDDDALRDSVAAVHTGLRDALDACSERGVGRAISASVFESPAPASSLMFMSLLCVRDTAAFLECVIDSMEALLMHSDRVAAS